MGVIGRFAENMQLQASILSSTNAGSRCGLRACRSIPGDRARKLISLEFPYIAWILSFRATSMAWDLHKRKSRVKAKSIWDCFSHDCAIVSPRGKAAHDSIFVFGGIFKETKSRIRTYDWKTIARTASHQSDQPIPSQLADG